MIQEYFYELTDPAHMMVEATWLGLELILEVLIFWFGARLVLRLRDRKHGHNKEN